MHAKEDMLRFMQKSAMAVSVFLFGLSGLVIAGSVLSNPFIMAVVILLFVWAGVELYIGFARTLDGVVPAGPLIKISRVLWLLFALYSWFDLRRGWTLVSLPEWTGLTFLFLSCAALALRIWAVVHLGTSFTYDVKRPAGNVLVRTGPYRFIRHPGYLGIIILAAFPGLIVGSIAGFIGLLLTTLVQTIARVEAEEKMLEEEFGDSFREYRRRTYRLLPFVY